MRTLRKENGGYALLYVLVIVVVLSAVAVSICAIALRNFQSQENSVREMKQLYQAEGEIEKFVALAEDVGKMSLSAQTTDTDAQKEYEEAALKLTQAGQPCAGCEASIVEENPKRRDRSLILVKSSDKMIQATVEMLIDYDIQTVDEGTPEDPNDVTYYTVKSAKVGSYTSYTITHSGGGEEENSSE